MKSINKLLIIFTMLIILNACGGLSDAGKVLRNEKTRTTDEFLVKKRDPLILPPDYSKLPKSQNSNNSKASSVEQLIIEKIGK